MTITMNKLVDVYTTFQDLSDTNASFKISYWITKNMNILNDDFTFFIQKRNALYDEYLEVKDGSFLTMMDNTHAKFNVRKDVDEGEFMDKFNDLLATECEITPYTIDLQTLLDSTLEISSQQLKNIQSFIKEE